MGSLDKKITYSNSKNEAVPFSLTSATGRREGCHVTQRLRPVEGGQGPRPRRSKPKNAARNVRRIVWPNICHRLVLQRPRSLVTQKYCVLCVVRPPSYGEQTRLNGPTLGQGGRAQSSENLSNLHLCIHSIASFCRRRGPSRLLYYSHLLRILYCIAAQLSPFPRSLLPPDAPPHRRPSRSAGCTLAIPSFQVPLQVRARPICPQRRAASGQPLHARRDGGRQSRAFTCQALTAWGIRTARR